MTKGKYPSDQHDIDGIKSMCERTIAGESGMSKNADDLAQCILDTLNAKGKRKMKA